VVSFSLVIPTCRRSALLYETLYSLGAQSEKDFEVLVVCDGEDPQTRDLSERYRAAYPLRWIFFGENRGLPAARNAGAYAAEGNILLFLDDDISPCPEWLAWHRRRRLAIEKSEWTIVLGRCHEIYARPPVSHRERLLRQARQEALDDFHERAIRLGLECSWFPHCGMNSSISRGTFLGVGGYDPASALRDSGHEDVELGTRLFNVGARIVYEPAAVVYHRNPKNLIEHHLQLAAPIGRSDLYRASRKQQRNAQTQRLTSLHRARRVRRLKERLAWEYPEAIHRAAEFCGNLTDLTGSKFFLRYWSGLATSVEYWKGVKSEGVTREALFHLVGVPVPVLMFHSVCAPSTRTENEWYIAPERFVRFMAWLAKMGYRCLSPMDWLAGKRPAHHIMLTFDDGYDDFYSEAFPVLERFGLRATVFVVVDRIGKSNTWDENLRIRSRRLLTLQEIRELHRHGVTFGSHSLTHADLTLLSDGALCREVSESKSRLEDLLGSEVTSFAYPGGCVNARVRAAVCEAGYKIGMSIRSGLNLWEDPLWMRRVNMSDRDTSWSFAFKVAKGRSLPQYMLEGLIQATRVALDVLPWPLSHATRDSLREVYWSASQRWWNWKQSRVMHPSD
jgi:peptidoglycan/xylan/chitin deacetylase (PgdA/CDA1 family)/GT2 family glycosyltransferase